MNGKINVGSNEKVTIDGEKVKEKINLETFKGDNPLMLGSAGYTFPAKTLLKDGLQIINSVNGEDLTDTVADQTTAVEELMKMVNRKIAMNNGEGQYVWKKLTAEGGDFIDFVVSNGESDYPNGAVHTDGYWYELVKEGVSGIDFGVVTFTGSVATFDAAHNLGVTPSYVGIFCPQTVSSTSATRAIFDSWYVKGTTVSSKTLSKDAINIKFYNGYYFAPDVPYVWVAIA